MGILIANALIKSNRLIASAEQEVVDYVQGMGQSDAQITALDTLVKNWKNHLGINLLTDVWDIAYILGGETQACSLRNLAKRAHDCTSTDMPTFTALEGFSGNGTTQYLDTNFNPATQGVRMQQDDASLFVYSRSNVSEDAVEVGCQTTAGAAAFYLSFNYSGVSIHGFNSGSGVRGTATVPSTGMKSGSRAAANNEKHIVNGILIDDNAIAHSVVPSFNIFICGLNNNGALALPSTKQLSFVAGGRALTVPEHLIIFNDFEAYMDGNGKGVI